MLAPVAPESRLSTAKRRPASLARRYAQTFIGDVFGKSFHEKRLLSASNGVVGVLHAATLTIHAIGTAYAVVAQRKAKHGIKQIDRWLSNPAFNLTRLWAGWVRFVVGACERIVIALDWTDCEKDDHTTLCAYLVTRHVRATPLLWMTVVKSTLEGKLTACEHELIETLRTLLRPEIQATLLVDRGFGDQVLYELLGLLGWDYIIRFRECIWVEDEHSAQKPAAAWVGVCRAKMLKIARVTADPTMIPAVVVVHERGMKESWCLATSRVDVRAYDAVKLYGKRFTIEEAFRDEKDIHFGLGLSATHIENSARRDRLLFLVAVTHALLKPLGAASEETGLELTLKANTSKKRTHSLFRQGLYWYHAMPNMREEWLEKLVTAFDRIVADHRVFVKYLHLHEGMP
jgi:Transposase DDE domain